jgi:integrase
MAVDDLWYLTKRGPDGERVASKRHGRGKRWRVRWVDDTGRPKQLLFERKADADRHDANVRADLSRGQYIDPGAGKMTVRAYAEQWRAAQLHGGATADRIERALRLHVYPTFGEATLSQVRPSQVQSWVKGLVKVLGASSVRVVYQVPQAVFAAAVLDRRIGATPFVGVQLPGVDRSDRFIPTPAQVHALADGLPNYLRALTYVAAGCGHRQGEAWGIEVEHIDFLRREIHIRQQVCACAGRSPHLALPKSKKTRTVELPKVTAEALARHIELYPPKEQMLLDETDPRRPVTRPARLVFVSRDGLPLRRSTWAYPWSKAVKDVALPKGFGYHGLRHYFATLLIHGGASVKTVQLALGHANPTVTLNTYVGEWPDAIDRTRNLVDAELGQQTLLKVAK